MKFLIITRELKQLRMLQKLVEKTARDPALFLEWDASKALDILEGQTIDILICETSIGENAYMDLLVKVSSKENRPEIIVLADPLERAMLEKLEELPAVFFLMLPLEWTRAKKSLIRAMERVVAKQHTADIERYRRYWESNKYTIQQQFWTRLCSGQASLAPSDFIKEAENCGITMKLSDTYQVAVLSRKLLQERNTEIERQTRRVLLELANNWFQKEGADYVILNQLRPLMIIRNMPNDEFLYQCKGLVRQIQQESGLPLCIYYDADVYCENIFSSVLSIMATEKEALEETPGVYPVVQPMPRKRNESDLPSLAYMETLLRSTNQRQIMENIRASIQEKAKKGEVTGSYLRAIRLDLTQTIYSILKEKSIPAHRVMARSELKELEANAHISIDSFFAWLEAALACLPGDQVEVSISEAVRSYVKTHIREDISRETIAAALYMNADYLGRLYKRETGRSLGHYIRDEKISEACHMLVFTQKSVGEIGAELGFENFSHFSKLFKQVTGCTPREYRNLSKTGNTPPEAGAVQVNSSDFLETE